jgi:hypothetical protein
MLARIAFCLTASPVLIVSTHASELEGDQLYRVSTVRAAAKAAGFKGRSDLSFYLRSLISGHHDTLAVKVD